MVQTRRAHERRERWLDAVWTAAGLQPLMSRAVELVDFEIRRVRKKLHGKARWRNKRVDGRWIQKGEGDPRLEKEFGGQDECICYTSCLLRIKLLNDEKLESWQLYKALFSAIQKRGYGDVPWKKRREAGSTDKPNEAAELTSGRERWDDLTQKPDIARLGADFSRPC